MVYMYKHLSKVDLMLLMDFSLCITVISDDDL